MPGDQWAQIEAASLDEAVRGLAEAARAMRRGQRRNNKVVADRLTELLQNAAESGTRAERHFAKQIRSRSSANWARIAITTAGGDQWSGALGTFFGSLKWKQFRDWVGAQWILGQPGEGPYVVRDVVPKHADEIGAWYLEARARDMAAAFPDGAPTSSGGW